MATSLHYSSQPLTPQKRTRSTVSLWFYPLAFLVAIALAVASIGPDILKRDIEARNGSARAGAILFSPSDLARGLDPGVGHVRFIKRGIAWTPEALRLAVEPNLGEASAADLGAQLLLGAEAQAALNERAVTVEVDVAPLPYTTGDALMVSLQNDGPAEWARQPLSAVQPQTLVFSLPAAQGAPPNAIGLWVVSSKADYNYGIEIRSIRVKPAQ